MDESEMERRRAIMIARLETRGQAVAKNREINKISREANDSALEELLAETRTALVAGLADDETEKRLLEALTICPSKYAEVKLRDALAAVRKAIVERETQSAGAFSFTGFVAPQKEQVPPATASSAPPPSDAGPSIPLPSTSASDDEIVIEGESGVDRTWHAPDGASVRIANISSSRISLAFRPSAVHVEGVRDTTLMMMPVATSVLIYGASNLTLYADAQQIRAHDVVGGLFNVNVRGAIIIEGCRGIEVAPVRITRDFAPVEGVHIGHEWRDVKDFDWLSSDASPNWAIRSREHWKSVDVETRIETPEL